MNILEISMKNFRGSESFHAKLHPELTVVVGNNGSGKSTFLDAISISVGTFFSGLDGVTATSIGKEDVTYKCYDMGTVIDLQQQYLTCDQHRRNTPLHVNPLNRRSISLITCKANGIIDSPDPVIRDDLTNILYLNCAVVHLPENSYVALMRLKRRIHSDYGNRTAPKAYFEHLIHLYCKKIAVFYRNTLG